MAPSVIFIDECEKVMIQFWQRHKVFVRFLWQTRRRWRTLELLSHSAESKKTSSKRCRSHEFLIFEFGFQVKALLPGEQVLVIGNSSEPQMCTKKDEKAFVSFWNKHIYIPLPDYSSRRILWPALFKKHNGLLPYEFDLSTLAHLSDGFASGTMHEVWWLPSALCKGMCQVAKCIMTQQRIEQLERKPILLEEIHSCLSLFQPVSSNVKW